MEINRYIDHTLLKNTVTSTDYKKLFEECVEHNFYSACVPPFAVKEASTYFMEAPSLVCSVAGFPFGYNTIGSKEDEINELYNIGCDEVDVVLNVSAVKSKDWHHVEKEFHLFSKLSKRKNCILKVIIESGILTDEELDRICKFATTFPVDFLKTSTGFAETSATLKAVKYMRENIPSEIQIKASGGIKNFKQAKEFLDAGADRLGCSASVAIVNEGK